MAEWEGEPEESEDLGFWEEGPPREPGAKRKGGPSAAGQVSLALRIKRYNPDIREGSWWDEFTVNVEPFDRLLDALHVVKWYRDGTLRSDLP